MTNCVSNEIIIEGNPESLGLWDNISERLLSEVEREEFSFQDVMLRSLYSAEALDNNNVQNLTGSMWLELSDGYDDLFHEDIGQRLIEFNSGVDPAWKLAKKIYQVLSDKDISLSITLYWVDLDNPIRRGLILLTGDASGVIYNKQGYVDKDVISQALGLEISDQYTILDDDEVIFDTDDDGDHVFSAGFLNKLLNDDFESTGKEISDRMP